MRNRARRILSRQRDRLPEWTRPRTWAVVGLSFLLALALTGLMLVDFRDPPDALLFIGRFHPAVVHFPIALILLAALLEGIGALYRPLRVVRHATAVVLFLGALSAAAAVVAGYLLSLEGGYDPTLVRAHFWAGLTVAVGAAAATLLKIRSRRRERRGIDRAYAGVLVACVAALVLAGHFGGALTHGRGYLTQYLPTPLKGVLGPEGARARRARIADIDSAHVYRDLVAPILEARCTSCHNESKMKGGLRLDTPELLLRGGNHGEVVVAGAPEESELLRRITLPPDAEGAMPGGGALPLDVGETELIRWWIANGASLDQRVADVEEIPSAVATLFTRIAPPRPAKKMGVYALQAEPADPKALAALIQSGYGIAPVAQDVDLLEVNTANVRSKVGDEELKRLLPVARQITWLDLGGTRVGDAGLAVVARMPNLTRLSLDRTAVGDEGIRHLSRLENLEYLNLFGSQVTDRGLEHLDGLDRLKSLYLWETRVTPEGAERLQRRRPELRLVLGTQPDSMRPPPPSED